MKDTFVLDEQSLESLYGPAFYIMDGMPKREQGNSKPLESPNAPELAATSPSSGIKWMPKANSKVLFVLHQAEFRDKDLGELLKKIVASIGMPFEAAGFGMITGEIMGDPFSTMPNPYAVVFDSNLRQALNNPMKVVAGEVFFSHRLSELSQSPAQKKELWAYLKQIQSKVS